MKKKKRKALEAENQNLRWRLERKPTKATRAIAWETLKAFYGDEPFLFAQKVDFQEKAIDLTNFPDSAQIEMCRFEGYGIRGSGWAVNLDGVGYRVDIPVVEDRETIVSKYCAFIGKPQVLQVDPRLSEVK